jgi:ketosteroid isomerase-like protein
MIRTMIGGVAMLALGAVAHAADKAPAAAAPAAAPVAAAPASAPATMPDMTKMGPMSRAVTKADKKGVDELYKAFEDAMMKGDINAAADLVDFPVIMLSDDSKGVTKTFKATRAHWIAIFTPFMPFMADRPKDMKMSAKHTPTFLSDTLAVSIESNGMSMGKIKGKWSAMSVLTLVDGKWKFKEMAEAGWGDMPGTSPAPATAKEPGTPAPTKPSAPAAKK